MAVEAFVEHSAFPPLPVENVRMMFKSRQIETHTVLAKTGECSEDVHQRVQSLAEAKVAKADTEPGYRALGKSREAQLSAEVAFLRRRLSITAVKEQARLLIDRLQLLGEGAGQAARRRDFAERSRRAEARERRAQQVCLMQGSAIRRSGFALLD